MKLIVAVEGSWTRRSDGRIELLISKEVAERLVSEYGYPSSADALLYIQDKNTMTIELKPRPPKE